MISRAKKSSADIAVCEFTVDSFAELTTLPNLTNGNDTMGWKQCLHGSSAFCSETGAVYTLRGTNEWKKVGV